MKITEKKITIRELVQDYVNDAEHGVLAYAEKLNVRPAYQREFVYKRKQMELVIDTIRKGFPLGAPFYWAVNSRSDLEVIDGQQRTISICEYVDGSYSVEGKYFHNLTEQEQLQILDYEVTANLCEGDNAERLEWFERINVAGEVLKPQELLNATYSGEWLTECKAYFSKTGCAASQVADKYLSGSPIRQDYLATVFDWAGKGDARDYMARNQHDGDAEALWDYFEGVLDWVKATFPRYRKEMKGLDWGRLHREHGGKVVDPDSLELEVSRLLADEDVTKKKGVFEFVLSGEERVLSVRSFSDADKRSKYEQQGGVCPSCGGSFAMTDMEGDHVVPWSKGGRSTMENLQMICKPCNRSKSAGL